jgi:hypothetical protein
MDYIKPDIDSEKILTKEEQIVVENALKFGDIKRIFNNIKPVKNDYNDEHDKGSVEYTPKNQNYCFHKVFIPDNSVVTECNFTQRKIDTQAIIGKNITFVRCNLTNNVIDPSWNVETSAYGKVDFEKIEKEAQEKEVEVK